MLYGIIFIGVFIVLYFICSSIGRMSTNFIIALTIALAVIANTRIVVARSTPMLPSEMLKDLESDAVSNRMVVFSVFFILFEIMAALRIFFVLVSFLKQRSMNMHAIWMVGHTRKNWNKDHHQLK